MGAEAVLHNQKRIMYRAKANNHDWDSLRPRFQRAQMLNYAVLCSVMVLMKSGKGSIGQSL